MIFRLVAKTNFEISCIQIERLVQEVDGLDKKLTQLASDMVAETQKQTATVGSINHLTAEFNNQVYKII